MEAATVAQVLVSEWICQYSAPNDIHTDEGRNSESIFFLQAMKTSQNSQNTIDDTVEYQPQSDGLVKRLNHNNAYNADNPP